MQAGQMYHTCPDAIQRVRLPSQSQTELHALCRASMAQMASTECPGRPVSFYAGIDQCSLSPMSLWTLLSLVAALSSNAVCPYSGVPGQSITGSQGPTDASFLTFVALLSCRCSSLR